MGPFFVMLYNMLMLKNRLGRDGFTLIEIVLVLALSGLILSLVFLAVSGAQKSRRDAVRKNDLARIAAQLEIYYGNNNMTYPQDATAWDSFWTTHVASGNFVDPSTDQTYDKGNYRRAPTAATPTIQADGTAEVNVSIINDTTYEICIALEQGKSCRTNK